MDIFKLLKKLNLNPFKLKRTLYVLKFKLTQLGYYYELKNAIINNEECLIKDADRNTGKSYTIFELAYKYDLPVYTPHPYSRYLIKEMDEKHGKAIKTFNNIEDLKGTRETCILVDELNKSEYEEIKSYNYRYGYDYLIIGFISKN